MKRRFILDGRELVLLGCMLFAAFLASFAQFAQKCDLVRSDVVRLHILANSDSEEDQALKLLVRDRILLETSDLFAVPQSQEQARETARCALGDIKKAAQAVLKEQGIDAPVNVQLTTMHFPQRQYESLSLPAGQYDAVRVTIGAGSGQNWWCVVYPPLCVPAARVDSSKELEEIIELNEEPLFIPKLAILEVVDHLLGNDE